MTALNKGGKLIIRYMAAAMNYFFEVPGQGI